MIAAALTAMSFTLTAAPVGIGEAQTIATSLLKQRSQGRAVATGVTMNLAHAEASGSAVGAVDYYVFNASDRGSFAIIAGDDRSRAVLAYGEGTLDMNNLPCGLQCMLEQYKEQLEWLAAHPGAQVEITDEHLAPTDGSVMPLLTCSWSQSEPYYNLCPTDPAGNHAVTGCIATAMAQVMYYWRYPSRLPAVEGYRYEVFTLEDLPPCTLDWNNMLDQYLGDYNETQATAIAVLMRYCGQGCHMMYGVDGSGSYMSSQRGALINFGYVNGIGSTNRDWYSASSWTSKMRDELNAGRPILYTAQANGGGHAFVIDGWHDGLFHINWGWAGTGNGYFALDAFNVRGYRFNSDQAMLTGVRPPSGSGASPVEDYDLALNGIYYKLDAGEAMVVSKDSGHNSYAGDVVIPDHITVDGKSLAVTAVGDGAFMNCTGLTSVTIPSTVKTIGRQAFRNCSGLSRVVIPDHVTVIGEQAFAHCVSLEQVTIPASLSAVDFDAFEGCEGMQAVDISDVAAWCAVNFSNSNSNPLFFARHLLLDGKEVTRLVIPSNAAAVGRAAFINCTSLRELVVEEGVQSLERMSFCYCDNLTSVTLPSTLTTLARSAFYECTSLPRVELPQGLQTIGSVAFYNCAALQEVTIPASVTSIGAQAFEACDSLNAVHIADLTAWCRINFDDEKANPLMCAGHLFLNGETFDRLVLPAGIDTIRSYAFAGDMDLKRVDFPSGVSIISDGAFMRCRNLETLKLNNELQHIGSNAFKGCSSLAAVTIPDKVETMGEGAFNNCSAMKYIAFGESIKDIGKNMCDGCKSLESLVIGSQVETIGIMAFYSCRNLTSVTCKASNVPQLAGQASFSSEAYKDATLQVPRSTTQDYSQASYWKYFKNIVGVDIHHDLPGDVNADGSVNIADINALIAAILDGNGNQLYDVNGDGSINITDINAIIDWILNN